MWQRFTESARKVVFYAQEEAGWLGDNFVSPDHLLLGLLRDDDTAAFQVLESLGVSRKYVRTEILKHMARGDGRQWQNMKLSKSGKRVIDLAYANARRLQYEYIGTHHLLLGVISAENGLGARVLLAFGVTLDTARMAADGVGENMGREPEPVANVWPPPPSKSLRPDNVDEIFRAAQKLADACHDPKPSSIHVLAAMLDTPNTAAAGILTKMGCKRIQLRTSLDPHLDIPKTGFAEVAKVLRNILKLRDLNELSIIMELAKDEAAKAGENAVTTFHVLLALAADETSPAGAVLAAHGITREALLNAIATPTPSESE